MSGNTPANKVKYMLFTMIPIIVSLSIFAAGFALGAYRSTRDFKHYWQHVERYAQLGEVAAIERIDLPQLALAYDDPAKTIVMMDRFMWDPPATMVPFVGVMPSPGTYGQSRIDEYHCRGIGELVMPKPARTFRIFLVGASTALGVAAPDNHHTIAGLLEQRLNEQLSPGSGRRYEVFSFAQVGWTSTHERIAIENRVSRLEPDLVIQLSGFNDAVWAREGENIFWTFTYGQRHLNNAMNLALKLSRHAPLPDVAPPGELPVPPAQMAQRTLFNIRQASYALSLHDVPHVFVLQPNMQTTGKTLSAREAIHLQNTPVQYYRDSFAALRQAMAQHTTDNPDHATRFIDLTTLFDAHRADEEIFLDSCHFGDKGNRLIAEALLPVVKSLATQDPAAFGVGTSVPMSAMIRRTFSR